MISIEKLTNNKFKVTVDADNTSAHIVTIQPDDYHSLTGGKISPERLLRESFQFLLEREPNTSILREFDLMVIQRYFPEYRAEIQSRSGLG
ncbi:MAG: hypothetical protein PVF85_01345 [Anaerolineales bacterium]|jgi:hypothetical protein